MRFSPDQERALETFCTWFEGDSRRFVLAGLAGTGKSTLVSAMIEMVRGTPVRIAAPTGKAAQVLRRKGNGDATTIHSLIYTPQPWCSACEKVRDDSEDRDPVPDVHVYPCLWAIDHEYGYPPPYGHTANPPCACPAEVKAKRQRILDTSPFCTCSREVQRATCRFHRAPGIDADLVFVDEASMVSTDLLEDLESFGVRLVFVGDHGQLPPVGNDPGILHEPNACLEQIHRQGEGSGIVRFAYGLRNDRDPFEIKRETDVLITRERSDLSAARKTADIIICGKNKTRVAVNSVERARRGFSGQPRVGESVICLRNDKDIGIHNGQIFTVADVAWEQERMWGGSVDVGVFDLVDDVGDEFRKIRFLPDQFGQEKTIPNAPRRVALFDFAYAITAHKSQGSEYDHVLVIDEGSVFRNEAARWRYTAATRAAKRLTWYAG